MPTAFCSAIWPSRRLVLLRALVCRPAHGCCICRCLHLADGQPQVFEDRWLNPAVLPVPEPDFTALSVNEWLVSTVAYLTGDIAFSAEAASAAEAGALSVPLGAALFITERCTWGSEAPITWVRLAHARDTGCRRCYRSHDFSAKNQLRSFCERSEFSQKIRGGFFAEKSWPQSAPRPEISFATIRVSRRCIREVRWRWCMTA